MNVQKIITAKHEEKCMKRNAVSGFKQEIV